MLLIEESIKSSYSTVFCSLLRGIYSLTPPALPSQPNQLYRLNPTSSTVSPNQLGLYQKFCARLNSSTLNTYPPALPSLSTKQVRSCREVKMWQL